jgi:hypothetical protein
MLNEATVIAQRLRLLGYWVADDPEGSSVGAADLRGGAGLSADQLRAWGADRPTGGSRVISVPVGKQSS